MKANITAKGMLIIESETALESYALEQWLKSNPIDSTRIMFIYEAGTIFENPIPNEKANKTRFS